MFVECLKDDLTLVFPLYGSQGHVEDKCPSNETPLPGYGSSIRCSWWRLMLFMYYALVSFELLHLFSSKGTTATSTTSSTDTTLTVRYPPSPRHFDLEVSVLRTICVDVVQPVST